VVISGNFQKRGEAMLNFEFTQDQNDIKNTVRNWARKNINDKILRKMEKDEKVPDNLISGLAELGLLGLTLSKEYGGIEADPVTVGVVAEELARADISCAIPTFYLVQAAWGYVFEKYGKPSVKSKYLPHVTSGKAFLGIAATEPDGGSDLGNTRTNAKKVDGRWSISGEKMFISGVKEIFKQMPMGGGYILLAKTDPSKGTRGMTLFYVPIKDSKNISPTYLDDWGRRGISTGGIALDDVRVSDDHVIGEVNKGFYLLMEGFDYARSIISVICAGAGMSALEQAMEYIKMRKTFGQPLAKYEGVQFKLADNWAKLEAVRLMGYKALWLNEKQHKSEGKSRFDVTKQAAMSKLLGAQFAFEAVNDALQWFGAYGYTTECPLDLALKGLRSYWWAEGALEVMRVIVGRELLGKDFVATK
jgi:acyl-CoA dehydrogenase